MIHSNRKRILAFFISVILLLSPLGELCPAGRAAAGEDSVSKDTVSGESVSDEQVSENITELNVYHRSQVQISAFIKEHPAAEITVPDIYKTEPSAQAPYSSGALTAKALTAAGNMLNQLRFAAGLDADVAMNSSYVSKAQAAAVVSAINKSIRRPPDKPQGMGKALYEKAVEGCNSCLLARNCQSLAAAVRDAWIPDRSNIANLGLRRWLLNPGMKECGFGQMDDYVAAYATDRSRNSEIKTVAWPAENMPLEWMDPELPWSVSFAWKLDEKKIKVLLKRESDGREWNFGKDKSDGGFYVDNSGYGLKSAVIFKPEGIGSYAAGERFSVSIQGASELTLKYNVDIFIPGMEVKLSNDRLVLPPGREYQLKAEVLPETAPQKLIWSSNSDIVQVGDRGLVKAVRPGKATVRVTSAAGCGIYAECEVEVAEESITAPEIVSNAGKLLDKDDEIMINAALPGKGNRIFYSVNGGVYKEYTSPLRASEIGRDGEIGIRAYVSANSASGYSSSPSSEAFFRIKDEDRRGDITEEDWKSVSINGVPDGIWVAGLKEEYAYTGKKISIPELRVYYKNIRLGKKDYSVKYRNNKDAGRAVLRICLKGNYRNAPGRPAEYGFDILPVDIEGEGFEVWDMCVAGKKNSDGSFAVQNPVPRILYNGKKTVSRDLDLCYFRKDDEERRQPMSGISLPGEYIGVIRGSGNYRGERSVGIRIEERLVLDQARAYGCRKKVGYDEFKNGQLPELSALRIRFKGGMELADAAGRFDISCSENGVGGRAYLVISAAPGDEEYAGTLRIPLTVSREPVKNTKISYVKTLYYTGEAVSLNAVGLSISDSNGHILEEGSDYTVSFVNNTHAGKAVMLIEGRGRYGGSVKKSFVIKARDISGLLIEMPEEISYSKKGNVMKKADISIYDPELCCFLEEGADYELKYSNNKKAEGKNAPAIRIRGRGNYRGSIKKSFVIKKGKLEDTAMIAGNISYRNKGGIYKTACVLIDTDGGVLKNNTDFGSVSYCYAYFTDIRNEITGEKLHRVAGEKIQDTDVLPQGCVIRIEAAGKGNYGGKKSCEAVVVKKDIEEIAFMVDDFEYSGKQIKPRTVRNDMSAAGIHAYFNYGSEVDASDYYHVMYYDQNLKKGCGKLTVTGSADYGGTRTLKFRINKRTAEAAESSF